MAIVPTRVRRLLLVIAIPVFIFLTLLLIRSDSLPDDVDDKLPHRLTGEPAGYNPKAKPQPLHKPEPAQPMPIKDNFPLAARAESHRDLPPIPSWNQPPKPHVKHATPLFIGFTRNWRLLQQTVVSYIAAGWPPADIYVVENTGVMNANKDGKLTLQNPFYLNHRRLTELLGVNVLTTPTLFTFAQLQNYYLWTSVQKGWAHYWWAHMDTVVISDEEYTGDTYKSVYMRAVQAMEETLEPTWGPLATIWFHYDRLALVRTQSFLDVGGWDTLIPFYHTDCDMHERLWMKGFKIATSDAGKIWDVGESLDDLGLLYKRGEVQQEENGAMKPEGKEKVGPEKNSPAYKDLLAKLDILQVAKNEDAGKRLSWQQTQKGGQGEPFYRDPDGFQQGIQMWQDFGKGVFHEKWGFPDCTLREVGLKTDDQWRVVKDWAKENIQRKYFRDKERDAKAIARIQQEGKQDAR